MTFLILLKNSDNTINMHRNLLCFTLPGTEVECTEQRPALLRLDRLESQGRERQYAEIKSSCQIILRTNWCFEDHCIIMKHTRQARHVGRVIRRSLIRRKYLSQGCHKDQPLQRLRKSIPGEVRACAKPLKQKRLAH